MIRADGPLTRRGLLASVGSSVTVLVAGCSDASGGPHYVGGEVDVDGAARTPEELVAAEALAERGTHENVTDLEALSIGEHAFVLEDGFTGSTVQGVVENTADERVDLVEVRARVYDDGGDQLGRYVTRTGDLDGGATWAFTVVVLESPADVAAYDVAVLGTPS